MGISGANFAVAETGMISITENEGNARLTTALPKIHVALVGIEKIVPRLEDLALFLPMLALFVIQLINCLHWPPRDQAGNEARLIGGEGGQDVDSWIERHKQVRIKTLGAFSLSLIDHFHHIMIGFGHDANLLD